VNRAGVADICPVPLYKAEATTAADFFDRTDPADPTALKVANSLIRLNAEAKICRTGKA